jgi:hypothetical protein
MTMAAGAQEVELADDILSAITPVLSAGGWQAVDGHPSLFLRSNTALMSALRCSFTAGGVTVASASMMFEEDRPLQLTVQPRGRDAFLAVCQALNRHAGKLDRLDYADCIADLLHHVPEVRLECETSGLVPTVATAAGPAVHYQPLPRPTWPPPEKSRAALNQRRRAGDSELLAWDPAQYKEFSKLLGQDRRRSLSTRLAHYEAKEMLRPEDAFVRAIAGGRHAVWLPEDDSRGAFAHSVGLAYLHDLPEILLISPMPAMIGATSRALALMVDAIADAMIGGVKLKPGDRYAVVAGTVARTVHKDCTLDQARLAQSCFVVPAPRIQERTLGAAAWFYANFMDATSFPVLACLLQPPRIPDGYGVPPPPPPAKAQPAVAKTAAPRARARRAAAPKAKAKAKAKRAPVKKPVAKKPVKKPAKKPGKARPRRK